MTARDRIVEYANAAVGKPSHQNLTGGGKFDFPLAVGSYDFYVHLVSNQNLNQLSQLQNPEKPSFSSRSLRT